MMSSKFVDSHMKPYRCKVALCEHTQFSSTACLLRHEREAHAMHGHGDKPYLCTFEGCERSAPGCGFPRRWNLSDHMKRVHNAPGLPQSRSIGRSPSPDPSESRGPRTKGAGKKRKPEVTAVAPNKKPVVIQESVASAEPDMDLQWQKHQARLLQAVQQLQDPRDPTNTQRIKDAINHLRYMAAATQKITGSTAMQRTSSQLTG